MSGPEPDAVAAVTVAGVVIEAVQGDITRQEGIDAIVNAANAQLRPGGGVAGAIHRAAGPGLAEECRPLAPIRTGQSVITGGHRLPNPWVIHTLGPVYGVDEPADRLLASCYRGALALADDRGLTSVAFPAISTGVFGYPIAEAAEVAVDAVVTAAPELRHVRRIRFVLFDRAAVAVHKEALLRRAAAGTADRPAEPGGSPA
ncbi:MAG TPA: macro domain-containing protein [Natronosporangium sp.]|nr:macro domain-containing protein [Natronosporangium sp.]